MPWNTHPNLDNEVDRLVHLAHDHLGMGTVYVAEFTQGRQLYRAVAGDAPSFGLTVGEGPALTDTYCALMVEGSIDNVIADTHADSRVSGLATTSSANIGAYLGVPLHLPDGQLYGTLCALSHTAQQDLNDRDAKFMSLIADFMTDALGRKRTAEHQREQLTGVLAAGNIAIALQPVVDVYSGRCIGMEALSRFPRELGAPDVVFTVAEELGMRFDVERLAVRRAVEVLPSLDASQSLAINVSPDVAFRLMPLVTEDRALDQIVLEITEHAAVEDYTCIRERLAPLRERGLRLAIDDAGAGYASLRHIVELRPDIIKIDRSLVAGIDSDPGRRSALTTFVLLALDIDAIVVAEGIETKQELASVAALGVDAVQGYLLARPSTDPADVARWASGEELLPVVHQSA